MDKYYGEFEDSEENKLIYTQIHKEYVRCVCVCFFNQELQFATSH